MLEERSEVTVEAIDYLPIKVNEKILRNTLTYYAFTLGEAFILHSRLLEYVGASR